MTAIDVFAVFAVGVAAGLWGADILRRKQVALLASAIGRATALIKAQDDYITRLESELAEVKERA